MRKEASVDVTVEGSETWCAGGGNQDEHGLPVPTTPLRERRRKDRPDKPATDPYGIGATLGAADGTTSPRNWSLV